MQNPKQKQYLYIATCHSLHHDIAEFIPPVKNVGSVMNVYIVYTGEICHMYYTL